MRKVVCQWDTVLYKCVCMYALYLHTSIVCWSSPLFVFVSSCVCTEYLLLMCTHCPKVHVRSVSNVLCILQQKRTVSYHTRTPLYHSKNELYPITFRILLTAKTHCILSH